TIDNVVVFEIQENSDVTYRLYDWDRIDKKTNKPRDLQVEQAMACVDYSQVELKPLEPRLVDSEWANRELLFDTSHFILWRIKSDRSFTVGSGNLPRIIVCIDGIGHLKHDGKQYAVRKGDVLLLPAALGECILNPDVGINILEIALPASRKHFKKS